MFDTLIPLAHDAGALALGHFGQLTQGSVSSKGPLDLVTVADRAVEALIVERLRREFPEDGILGEEGGTIAGTTGRLWVIDPIDGTFNFVRGGKDWAVSIGLWQDGEPVAGIVHAPVQALTLTAGRNAPPQMNGKLLPPLTAYQPERGAVSVSLGGAIPSADRIAMLRFLTEEARIMFRCNNAATLSLIEVATGEVDGHIGYGESVWDVMAIWPILTALGAVSTLDWSRTHMTDKLRYVIGKPDLVDLCRPLAGKLSAD